MHEGHGDPLRVRWTRGIDAPRKLDIITGSNLRSDLEQARGKLKGRPRRKIVDRVEDELTERAGPLGDQSFSRFLYFSSLARRTV